MIDSYHPTIIGHHKEGESAVSQSINIEQLLDPEIASALSALEISTQDLSARTPRQDATPTCF